MRLPKVGEYVRTTSPGLGTREGFVIEAQRANKPGLHRQRQPLASDRLFTYRKIGANYDFYVPLHDAGTTTWEIIDPPKPKMVKVPTFEMSYDDADLLVRSFGSNHHRTMNAVLIAVRQAMRPPRP